MKSYYYFAMDIDEVGFKGEARIEYSGRLTPAMIRYNLSGDTGGCFNFEADGWIA